MIKTQAGLEAFKQRSTLLTQRQRAMFLLCDGRRGVEAVLAETATVRATAADLDYLVAQGFLVWEPEAEARASPSSGVHPTPSVQRGVEGEAYHGDRWTMF
ncbi:MAG: hypothetical protein WAW34_01635 [Rhodoferax sp.]